MARAYQSPLWQQTLSIGLTLAVYVYPLFLFLQYPERILGITRVFILFPLLYLFFLLAPTPDANIPANAARNIIKPLAIIAIINSLFFFISQTIIPSLIFITTEIPSRIHFSLHHEQLALWTLFSLYTGVNHYFVHREQKAPLASAALYAAKKSYAAIVLARMLAMFASFGNFMLIYFLISVAMLFIFRLHGPLAIGFNPILMLGLLFILFIAALLIARFSRLVSFPFKLQNRHYLLIATLLSGMTLYHFYTLSLPYLTEEGFVHTLYQAFEPTPLPASMIALSQYGFFLLAIPFASGFILRFSENLRTKTVLILTMAPCLAFYDLGSLPVGTPLSIISILITLCCIFLGTKQKNTADFLIGPFSSPRQRYIVVNRSSKLFFAHLIGPISILAMILNFGLQPIMGTIFVAGTSLLIVTLINICGFYGRILRLTFLQKT